MGVRIFETKKPDLKSIEKVETSASKEKCKSAPVMGAFFVYKAAGGRGAKSCLKLLKKSIKMLYLNKK